MTDDITNTDEPMIPNRPYLLRALHEWIVDNQMTPHILVNALVDNIKVPPSTIRNGKVVLNVDPDAVRALSITNTHLTCSARFNGQAQQLYVPIEAVLAIYARENGRGMMFADEAGFADSFGDPPEFDGDKKQHPEKDRSHLQVVK